jgi:hypothetical protein
MKIEQIKKETEKALLLTVEVETAAGRRAADLWWPKSQIAVSGDTFTAPEWLVRAKLAEKFGTHSAWIN